MTASGFDVTSASDFFFEEEHKMLRDQVRRFVEEEIKPHADQSSYPASRLITYESCWFTPCPLKACVGSPSSSTVMGSSTARFMYSTW